jgi:hypothetical protein
MKVYIAGPYSHPDPVINTRNAIRAADILVEKGHIPYIPHLTMFWHLVSPHRLEFWYEYDKVWLRFCNAVLRLPGDSKGADDEMALATSLGLPIYHDFNEIPEGVEYGTRHGS